MEQQVAISSKLPTRRGVAGSGNSRDNGAFMGAETQTTYLEYVITITEVDGRFTPRVTRPGGWIEHDGRVSEAWAAASCASLDRAVQTAKTAIDNDRIR
jgi:hypothetical protein